jgi:hypothetical protein
MTPQLQQPQWQTDRAALRDWRDAQPEPEPDYIASATELLAALRARGVRVWAEWPYGDVLPGGGTVMLDRVKGVEHLTPLIAQHKPALLSLLGDEVWCETAGHEGVQVWRFTASGTALCESCWAEQQGVAFDSDPDDACRWLEQQLASGALATIGEPITLDRATTIGAGQLEAATRWAISAYRDRRNLARATAIETVLRLRQVVGERLAPLPGEVMV